MTGYVRLMAVLLCLAAGPATGAPALAAPLPAAELARIGAYLNGLTAFKARFVQIAADGHESDGEAWLWRPGRMRFQYDPPSPLLLVADGTQVIFRDNELEQTSTIPLKNTPLGILLSPHIDLADGSLTVLGLAQHPGLEELTVTRAANPEEGTLTLDFSTDPLQLRSWVVTDAQNQQTKVSLFDAQSEPHGFDPQLFVFKDPNLEGK